MCSSDIVYLSSYFRDYLLGELWRKCGLCRCRPRKGRFNWWNAMFRSRLLDSCGLRCKLAASAIAMNMPRKVRGRAFNTRASQGMKSRESLTPSAPVSLDGKSGSEWESAGTADI